ncbi:MAG TPA: hypothetical protein PKC76_10170 [Saprospiraceae bacterium]|nr:hypothetical protein [Saprospiraceae bacterium]HMP24488.1 hypothetical protein [Saprospiraceae bacterium]
MFSINIYLRLALIAACLVGGVALTIAFGFWYAFPFFLIGIVLLVGYLLLGTVQSAAMLLQETKFIEATKRLNLTLSPRLLYATNRAYFFILKGTIAVALNNTDEGEMWLKKAQQVKLPTDNEKAMIELQLANIAAQKGKWQQAQLHFRNTKGLKITDANIREQHKQFEKALNQRGQIKAAGQQGGSMAIRPGGKRRRPKMR